jgi:hypothetical protein
MEAMAKGSPEDALAWYHAKVLDILESKVKIWQGL